MEKQSKRISLVMKKVVKFQQSIAQCQKHILNHEIPSAVSILKQLILNRQFLDLHQFKGEGNLESWRFCYPKGLLQWLKKHLENKQAQVNQFDLLNICFMIQLGQKVITFEDCLKEYFFIQEKLGERPQIILGIGNAFYHNQEYLKAERQYFKVLNVIPGLEKGLEAMAWTHHMLENREQTLQYSLKCLQINPQNLNALFLKVRWIESKGFNNQQELLKIVKENPHFYRIYIEAARLSQNQSNSLQYFQKAFQFEPTSAQITALLGLKLLKIAQQAKQQEYRKQKIQAAKQKAKKLLAQKNNCPLAYYLSAKIYIEEYNWELAAQICNQGLQLFPHNVDLLKKLADIQSIVKIINNQPQQYEQKCLVRRYVDKYENSMIHIFFT